MNEGNRTGWKNKIPYLIVIFVLICVCIILGVLLWRKEKGSKTSKQKWIETEEVFRTDAQKFKQSYEALNDTTREDGTYLPAVSIEEENPIYYITPEQAWEKIDKNETVIIAFGANWCRWCRVVAPLMVDMMNANGVEKVYYVEVENQDSGDKTEECRSLEKLISNYLCKAGTSFANVTGTEVLILEYQEYLQEKEELPFPITIFVNKGTLTGMHVGTVSNQTDITRELTDQQKDEFRRAYKKHMDVLGTSPCGRC